MRNFIIYSALVLLLSVNCYSQLPEDFPSINKNDLPGAKFQPARTFNGASLFGYIDGGAELYLEYGFSSVWISEIGYMGGKYKAEIYKMNGQEEAFGIFSVSKYKCKSFPPVFTYTCQTRYQLQICSGQYYISIINGTGNKSDSTASIKIGEAIVHKITQPSFDLTSYFPGLPAESIKSSAILARGKLGLINGVPDWEEYFKGATGYTVVILPGQEKMVMSVKFKGLEETKRFVALHNWEMEKISSSPVKFSGGELVSELSENHLLIEIQK
jgi:hypothetical protein